VAVKERQICTLDELPVDTARAFSLGDDDWPFRGFVVRLGDAVHAFVNRCPHQKHQLNMEVHDFLTEDQQLIRCASHGAMFEKDSGLCVVGPCVGRSLAALDCRVADQNVLVMTPDSMRDYEELQQLGLM